MKELLFDIKHFGIKVAWWNVKFNFAYWLLGATSMKVTSKNMKVSRVK